MKIKTYCYEEWNQYNCKDYQDKDSHIQGRMEKALGFYDVAVKCKELGFYASSADRLYFSLLNACRALLLSINKETGDFHSLVIRIYLNFVLKGLLEKKDYELVIELYNLWQKTTFKPMVYTHREDVVPYFEPVKDLLLRIVSILKLDVQSFKTLKV